MNKFYFYFLCMLVFSGVYAQSGILDSSYGTNGIVTTVVSGTFNFSAASALQADGKVVVSGYAGEPAIYKAAIARYNTDGSLDSSFGNNGTLIVPIGSNKSYATDIALQSDGKIVLGAYTWDNVSGDFALVRLNTDGSLDTTFGNNGISIANNGNDVAESVTLQDDGKIILGGYTDDNFSIARFNTDGTLDTTFGTNGWAITEFDTSLSFIKEIGVQNDGKIVLAGFAGSTSNTFRMAVARRNADGTIDNTFGTNGKIAFNIGSNNDFVEGMVLQDDGKIVLGGHTYIGSAPLRYDMAAVRLNADGSFDTTYGTNGVATARIVAEANYVRRMNIQTDGKVVLAGFTVTGPEYDLGMVRFNVDGTLDTTFGTDGMVQTDVDGREDYGTSVLFQADQKIILTGYSYTTTGEGEFVVARYSGDVLGIAENEILEFSVYPNPSSDFIIIDLNTTSDTFKVEIVDVQGKKVYTSAVQKANRIDVSTFASGMYLVKVTTETKSGVLRFVKK